MVLFTRGAKQIKGVAHKNGDVDSTYKWALILAVFWESLTKGAIAGSVQPAKSSGCRMQRV